MPSRKRSTLNSSVDVSRRKLDSVDDCRSRSGLLCGLGWERKVYSSGGMFVREGEEEEEEDGWKEGGRRRL